MQNSIPGKQKSVIIYIIIILSFLLLSWIIWLFFEARIKEVDEKKNNTHALLKNINNHKYDQQPNDSINH